MGMQITLGLLACAGAAALVVVHCTAKNEHLRMQSLFWAMWLVVLSHLLLAALGELL